MAYYLFGKTYLCTAKTSRQLPGSDASSLLFASMASSSIVITSIFAPTEAVAKFAKLTEHQLIVAGDKKSPATWNEPNVTYLSVADQEAAGFRLSEKLPFNHYGRKMMGYLHAIKAGAEVIIDTDDDNIPYDNWSFPATEGTFATSPANQGFVNIYKNFTSHHIWPRGYPLDLILDESHNLKEDELTRKPPRSASGRAWPTATRT